MHEPWRLPPQSVVDLQLAKSTGQQIISAADFGHSHLVIIDNHRQLIGGSSVLLADYKVAQLAGWVAIHSSGN